ncbi:MAG: family 10 glycosylhydrolase [Candidatus Gastranaerophilaceae bacterium]
MKKFLILFSIIQIFIFNNCANAFIFHKTKPVVQNPVTTKKIVYVKTSEYPINVIDPNEINNPLGKNYPGFRANNQLVIYTPVYGGKTGTNEFGAEVTIINNKVIKISGMDSYIPQNGFIISGHGKAKEWIKANLFVGANAEIDFKNNKIKAYSTPESFSFQAEQKIQQVQNTVKASKTMDIDIDTVNVYLDRANRLLDVSKELLKFENYSEAMKYAENASMHADRAFYNAIPYKKNEFKGIWVRPTEKNEIEISRTLDEIKSTGIDNVFLETYYQGYTIYPSAVLAKYGVKVQKDEFKGFDPLKIWIEQAHKKNMKIHVWFQTFYAGNDDLSKNKDHILSKKPEWANVQRKNIDKNIPCYSVAEHNGYFLDPANPDVQNYLYKLINEIVSKYNIDGINIDYIRYPVSLAPNFSNYQESTWGYSNYARNEFKSVYNVDPACLTPKDPLWIEWNRYKELKINNFVYKLKNIKKLKKNIMVSAVIFPNETESSVLKSQNWKVWPQFDSIDALTPLIMASDTDFTRESLREIKTFTNGKVKVYPGIFEMFTDGKPADLLNQILTTRESGADGIVIFDYAHINKDFVTALKARVFKTPNEK